MFSNSISVEPAMGEKVTISDCARALNAIEGEIEALERTRTETQRRIDALRTQGRVIAQLMAYV